MRLPRPEALREVCGRSEPRLWSRIAIALLDAVICLHLLMTLWSASCAHVPCDSLPILANVEQTWTLHVCTKHPYTACNHDTWTITSLIRISTCIRTTTPPQALYQKDRHLANNLGSRDPTTYQKHLKPLACYHQHTYQSISQYAYPDSWPSRSLNSLHRRYSNLGRAEICYIIVHIGTGV